MHRPLQADTAAPAWNALQRRTLAAMQVELYMRRHLPGVTAGVGAWSEADLISGLAAALARAAGAPDVGAYSAANPALPDLAQLRRDPAAKRALWQSLRSGLTRR